MREKVTCNACDHEFLSDDRVRYEIKKCPECGNVGANKPLSLRESFIKDGIKTNPERTMGHVMNYINKGGML